MKDNKPLIFINSAQSDEFKDNNQYVYDSRYSRKKNIFESPKINLEEKEEVETIEKVEAQKEEKKIEDINQEVEEEVIVQKESTVTDENHLRKLLNKIELLNKRASLGRYVFVSVELFDKVLEGFFIKHLGESIILSVENEDHIIDINEIKDITIVRV